MSTGGHRALATLQRYHETQLGDNGSGQDPRTMVNSLPFLSDPFYSIMLLHLTAMFSYTQVLWRRTLALPRALGETLRRFLRCQARKV